MTVPWGGDPKPEAFAPPPVGTNDARRSLGHPDPGAVSFGLIAERIATYVESGAGTSGADDSKLAAAAGKWSKK